jgi:hypothetical protein
VNLSSQKKKKLSWKRKKKKKARTRRTLSLDSVMVLTPLQLTMDKKLLVSKILKSMLNNLTLAILIRMAKEIKVIRRLKALKIC